MPYYLHATSIAVIPFHPRSALGLRSDLYAITLRRVFLIATVPRESMVTAMA